MNSRSEIFLSVRYFPGSILKVFWKYQDTILILWPDGHCHYLLKIANFVNWLEMVTVMMKPTLFNVALMEVIVATYALTKNIAQSKGIYNRLSLIMSYLLDIDLALWSLLLPWEVKLNKSWNTFNKRNGKKIITEGMIQTWDLMLQAWHPSKHGFWQFAKQVVVCNQLW